MAENRTQFIIEAIFEESGFKSHAADVAKIIKQLERWIKKNEKVGLTAKDVESQLKKLANRHIKDLKKMEKHTDDVAKAMKKAGDRAAGWAKSLVFPGGFIKAGKDAVGFLQDYNKQLILASGAARKYGMGAKGIDKSFKALSRSTGLLRKEMMGMWVDFEKSMPIASLEGFAIQIKSLSEAFGPNIDAIKAMQGHMSKLVQLYPDLTSASELANETDIKRMQNTMQLMRMSGDASLAEQRALQMGLDLRRQSLNESKEEIDARRKQTEAWQLLQQAVERIKIALGEALVPVMLKVSEMVQLIVPHIDNLFGKMGEWIKRAVDWWSGLKHQMAIIKGIAIALGAALIGNVAGSAITAVGMAGKALASIAGMAKGARLGGMMGGAAKGIGALGVLGKAGKFAASGAMLGGPWGAAAGLAAGAGIGAWQYFKGKKQKKAAAAAPEADVGNMEGMLAELKDIWKTDNDIIAARNQQSAKAKEMMNDFEVFNAANQRLVGIIQEQVGGFQELLNLNKFTGELTIEEAQVQRQEISANIQKRIGLMKQLLSMADENAVKGEADKRMTEDQRAAMKEMFGREGMTGLALVKVRSKLNKEILQQERQKAELGLQMAQAVYNPQLENLKSQANVFTSLVSLADNYAIGVGASAKMRMNAVAALQQEANMMKRSLVVLQQELANNEGNRLQIQTEIYNMQQRMTQNMQQQAQLTRQLKDGWISAIGAMNTGSGAFSKIVISQTENTAQMLKLGGAVSAYSGSLSGGYKGSAKYSALGGFSGAMQRNFAYDTTVPHGAGNIEAGLRGNIAGMVGGHQALIGDRAGGLDFAGQSTTAGGVYKGAALESAMAPTATATRGVHREVSAHTGILSAIEANTRMGGPGGCEGAGSIPLNTKGVQNRLKQEIVDTKVKVKAQRAKMRAGMRLIQRPVKSYEEQSVAGMSDVERNVASLNAQNRINEFNKIQSEIDQLKAKNRESMAINQKIRQEQLGDRAAFAKRFGAGTTIGTALWDLGADSRMRKAKTDIDWRTQDIEKGRGQISNLKSKQRNLGIEGAYATQRAIRGHERKVVHEIKVSPSIKTGDYARLGQQILEFIGQGVMQHSSMAVLPAAGSDTNQIETSRNA